MTTFQPPRDWDDVYAKADGYFFGEEPSQLCRSAVRFFQAFGGDPEGALALDLGSGEGRDAAFLAASGFGVVARDLSQVGLDKTQALLDRQGVPVGRVDLARQDVRDFPYPAEAYDLALAANVYQFLPPEEVPGHVRRLQGATKPGGICAVGVFSPAMSGWGVETEGYFTATADELRAYFAPDEGWLLLDRTDYWIYRLDRQTMGSFAYVVARKTPTP